MDARGFPIVLLIVATFVSLTVDKCLGLKCFHCGWSANKYEVKRPTSSTEDPPPYPVADTEVGNKTHPPTRDMMNEKCRKETCKDRDPTCMKWSFLSGSPENITFMCVGNPGNRKGCYEIDVPHGDKEKKYNTKLQKVEVCLCNDEDLCNASSRNSSTAVLALTMTIALLVANEALLKYR